MADTAQTHANGVASDRTEWYGGATRFELELEVQHQSIHLLIRKVFVAQYCHPKFVSLT
jgi:hypothetical protein